MYSKTTRRSHIFDKTVFVHYVQIEFSLVVTKINPMYSDISMRNKPSRDIRIYEHMRIYL